MNLGVVSFTRHDLAAVELASRGLGLLTDFLDSYRQPGHPEVAQALDDLDELAVRMREALQVAGDTTSSDGPHRMSSDSPPLHVVAPQDPGAAAPSSRPGLPAVFWCDPDESAGWSRRV